MVANGLEAIAQAIKLRQGANVIILTAQQQQNLDTSHVPALLGNWCSHYETASGTSLSVPMLKGVIQTIDDLSDCFMWDDTSGIGRFHRNRLAEQRIAALHAPPHILRLFPPLRGIFIAPQLTRVVYFAVLGKSLNDGRFFENASSYFARLRY